MSTLDRTTLDVDRIAPAPAIDTTGWQDLANCKGQTKLFFAPKAERPQARARRERAAKALCDACPVLVPCRQSARDNHEYGFWGGESEEERHLLGYRVSAPIGVRRRTAAAAATETTYLASA